MQACCTVPAAEWPLRRANDCFSSYRPAISMNTFASNADPQPDRRRSKNREACSGRKSVGSELSVWTLEDLIERDTFFDEHHRDIFTNGIQDLFVGPDQAAVEHFGHRLLRLILQHASAHGIVHLAD